MMINNIVIRQYVLIVWLHNPIKNIRAHNNDHNETEIILTGYLK